MSNTRNYDQHDVVIWEREKKREKISGRNKEARDTKGLFFQKFSLMISPQRFDKFDYLNYIF